LSGLPAYAPAQKLSGRMRMWGMNYIQDAQLKQFWDEGFHRYHPDVRIEYFLPTAVTAVPALVTGQADLGANTNMWQWEKEEFEQVFGYAPLSIEMVICSYNVAGWGAADAVFVHKDNPLTRLSLRQLDGIFGTLRDGAWIGTTWHTEYPYSRGAGENIRTWGRLGLAGEWADRPVHVYNLQSRYGTAIFLSDSVLHGGDKINETSRVYADLVRADGTEVDAAVQLMADLSQDRYGIGFSGPEYRTPRTKPLELAASDGGPYAALTIENVQNRTYPLARETFWYFNRQPGKPVDSRVKEFVTYALSREGQQEVARDGLFLPLTAEIVRAQLKKLD
jgi:phosphate transport system substrate-binding protein